MEDTQPPRLICLAQAIRNPWLATVVAASGSVAFYIFIHYLLHLPISLTTGIFISIIIPFIIGHPIFVLVSAQNSHICKQNHQLKELNEQKNVLLSLIAHDMRSPLAQLKQTLDFAAEDSDYAKEAVADFPAINRRVDKTLGLLDNLLTWSRGAFHANTGAVEEVALSSLIDDLAEQLQEPLQEKQLVLHNHIDAPLTLHTRADLLKLVLRNLISNAIKYTPEHGHIDIDCQAEGRGLCLSVSDNGVGMDDKTLGKLFGSERISTQPGTRGETGSGIGLLLCKQLLHSIGGSIRAESQPGQGSTFHVCLPRRA
jgi:two-component system sensor histidine kinase/response regulator